MRCFFYAARGFAAVVLNELNMRIHLAFAFYVILAGLVCAVSAGEWCALLICIALVLSLECMNTAIEAACDEVSTDFSPKIRLAKDVAAGAVLVAAIISAVVGGIIFFNQECINKTIEFTKQYPIAAAIIVLTLPIWIKYINMRRSNKCLTSQNQE